MDPMAALAQKRRAEQREFNELMANYSVSAAEMRLFRLGMVLEPRVARSLLRAETKEQRLKIVAATLSASCR